MPPTSTAYGLATHLSGDPDCIDVHGWPQGVGDFAAAMCWLLDARVTKSFDRSWYDPETGSFLPDRPRAFTLHPIRWCGGAMVVLGVVLCCYHRTPHKLWQSRQRRAARLEAPPTHLEPPPTATP